MPAAAPNAATVLERVLAAAKERELAAPALAAYRRPGSNPSHGP